MPTKLPFNPKDAIELLSKKDRTLGKLIKQVGPFRLEIEPMANPFHSLAESIVYQQLTGKAAATIFSRVKALYESPKYLKPEHILATDFDTLRQAGLSGSKALALQDLAAKAHDGQVPTNAKLTKMSDDEIKEQLIKIRGIGPWTVEMMLIFQMGRPDVLPIHDYGVRKGFARTFKSTDLPAPKQLLAAGEKWRPFRTVASWYLWRALEIK
jgi:DNA-3-methyladenine glycosylase II